MPRTKFPLKSNVNVVETSKIKELENAPTFIGARGEFYRLFFAAKAVLTKVQNLGEQKELFFELASSPRNEKSFGNLLKSWKLLGPIYASKKINHPGLTSASAKIEPLMLECKRVYRDLELDLLLDENLKELEDLAEDIVIPINAYLFSGGIFAFEHISKQYQREWLQLADELALLIRTYRQFIENRKLVYRFVDMFKQSSQMAQSTAQGAFRFTWYPEKVTILQNQANGKPREIQGHITEYVQDQKPETDLQFVATPTSRQIVEVNYQFSLHAIDRWGRPETRGKFLEEYDEDETAPVRHIKQIQILELTADPACRPKQIVDMAAKYLLNCRKNTNGKPLFPIQLTGPYQLALKAAFLNLGVTQINCPNPQENQWPENELSDVRQVAKQRFKEIERLINPCMQNFSERRLPLAKQLDRHSDALFFGNQKFSALQKRTVDMVSNMKMRFQEFHNIESANAEDQNAGAGKGLRLRAIE